MRKIILLIMVALLLVTIAGCKIPQNQLVVVEENDEVTVTDDMEKVIAEYIEEQVAHKSHNGISFSAQEFYGTEQKNDGQIYVYLWTYYQEYYLENGELASELGGGSSLPLVIVLEEDDHGEFNVIEHHRPLDGSEYASSIRKLFPEKYHDRIFSRNNVHDLEPLVRQKAEAYFNINISEALGKAEELLTQSDKVDITAAAFDGSKNIKFRLMVEKEPSEAEAINLFNQILDTFVSYTNRPGFWNYYNGYFDIKSYESGVIYEAEKMPGKNLKIYYKGQKIYQGAVVEVEKILKDLGFQFDELLHTEEVDNGFFVFYVSEGKLSHGYLELEETQEGHWQVITGGDYINLLSGGYATAVYGEAPTFLTYAVATNSDVENLLVDNEPATRVKASEEIEVWFAITDQPAQETDIVALNKDGDEVPLTSYEHIQVSEEDQKVDVNIMLWGTGSQTGLLTFTMNRSYENETGSPLYFEETIILPGYRIFREDVPPSDILSVSENLNIERTGNGYKVSGKIEPFETQSITLLHQYDSSLVGGAKGKTGWYFGQNIDLYNYGENTRLNSINVNFKFPPGTTDLSNKLHLAVWDKGTVAAIEPHIDKEFLSISWILEDKKVPMRAGGDAVNEEMNLAGIEFASVGMNYSVRVNSLPHYLTYLAIGLGLAALAYSYLLSRRIKKMQSDDKARS
ncbi:hypothetical protein [Desulfitibacter alkalitolerans]|uniref:hypothetical protein n=1 Tax=Desulfitibacter alkalitolerans TaxID=264641 RepID=UPI00068593A7|nr:hypothetical protein [Desulfitibacter alkalitolerans]